MQQIFRPRTSGSEWTGVGNCILGYPDEDPAMKPRKENYVRYIL